MPSYLVETYLARGDAGKREEREWRAHSAAEELTRAGTHISFEGSIHVPEDEICFFTFEASSGSDAALVAQVAGLDPLRVVEAVASETREKGVGFAPEGGSPKGGEHEN